MALRNIGELEYLPFLSLRPAEMRALEELPNRTKDALLPLIQLRPWGAAHHLASSVNRIQEAYGDRPVAIALGFPEPVNTRRPVHDELDELRQPLRGFQNWCNFIEENSAFIPALQFGPVAQEIAQIECLHALGRGVFVVIPLPGFGAVAAVAERVAAVTQGGQDVCFVLDYLRASQDHLQRGAATVGLVETILREAPHSRVAISASSFPDSFVNNPEQPIYERRLFDLVQAAMNNTSLLYSDRGSARVERQQGGGGAPSPRIDYPLRLDWRFYRSDNLVGFRGYQQQAQLLMRQAQIWNPRLRVWGTQLIERTAVGDASAISNPARSTAARINLHLQVQTYYDQPDAAEETDEEWEG